MTGPTRSPNSGDGRTHEQYCWCDACVPRGPAQGPASRSLVVLRLATWTAVFAIAAATALAIISLTGVLS